MAQTVQNVSAMQKTQVQSLGWDTHACLLYDPNSVKSGSLLSIGNWQHCGGRRNPKSDPIKMIVPIKPVM